MSSRSRFGVLSLLLPALAGAAQEPGPLPGTGLLAPSPDPALEMTIGIDQFLARELERSMAQRARFWQRDFASTAAYEKSIQPNREQLRRMIGAVETRAPAAQAGAGLEATLLAEAEGFTVHSARWPVLDGVNGEGLLLLPKAVPVARVVAIPDADQTPEMLAGLAPGLEPVRQFARRLAENGCEVLVPVLVDRQDTWSGNPAMQRLTNQPHREWVYRQAFELGRHIIGFEVQKVLAAIDALEARGHSGHAVTQAKGQAAESRTQSPKVAVAGYGEGGLIAFYSAALDPRISAALVSGYFDSRQRLWEEPIYRNVFGLLREFGDAEIASLIAPRGLIVEHSPAPAVPGPPAERAGRAGAAPGKLATPDYESVEAEFERAQALLKPGEAKGFAPFALICGAEGMAIGPASDPALTVLLNALGLQLERIDSPGPAPARLRELPDAQARQQRQVEELQEFLRRHLNWPPTPGAEPAQK